MIHHQPTLVQLYSGKSTIHPINAYFIGLYVYINLHY